MVIGCRFPKEIGIGTVRHLGRNSLPHARLFSFEGTALRVGAPYRKRCIPFPLNSGL